MIEFGHKITSLGFSILPYSFFVYIVLRPIGYILKLHYFKIVKAIWYLASGIAMLAGDVIVGTVVMFIAFIEAYDLMFQFFEDKRKAKASH